ncbi:MAG TPA: diguanylate cyclase, partial [Candidatus Hypogeohydataceae bacterium YC38]
EPEQGVIANVTRVILSSLSIKDTYSSLVAELRRVIDFDRASIALLSEEKDVVLTYVASTVHESAALKEGQPYPLKGSVVERLSITRKPIIIEDTEKGELDTDRLLYKEGLRSRLCYPLISKGRFIGTLNFSSKKPGAYSRRHLRLLGWIAPQLAMAVENSLLAEKLGEESIRDPLTNAYNRRHLFERLKEEISRSKRDGLPFGMLMCDINRFKLLNDLYGHGVGDEVLRATTRIIKDAIRDIDTLCRYGGDEFIIILPDTMRTGAVEVASRLNKALLEHTPEYLQDLPFRIEISTGIVIYPSDGDTIDELLGRADHAMYRAKLEPGHLFPTLEGLWEERPVDLHSLFLRNLAEAVDIKDGVTHRHSQMVSSMAVALAHELGGLTPQEIKNIQEAALVHDVGKITIPDRILNKPGKLTEEEWAIMKGHVERGIEILERIPESEEILPIVVATHEHYDGTGYPRGLSGKNIPLESRIIAVVDAYQALVSKRPYRPAKSPEEALEILRASSGKEYDPKIVRIFISLLKKGEGYLTS